MSTMLSVGAALFSTVAQMGAANEESESAARLATYRASVAENNRKIAEQNARVARERAAIEAQDSDLENMAAIGAIEALQGASGLTGRSQSRVRSTARRVAAEDRNRIRYKGETQAHAAETQAESYRAEADLERTSAENIRRRSRRSVLPTLIGGATSVLRAGRFGSGLLAA